MSDKKEKDAKPAKGKGKIMVIAGALGMLAVGGGGAYGLVASGIIGGGGKSEAKEEKGPQLIRKGEEDPYAPKGDGKEKEAAPVEGMDGDGGSEFRTAYYTFSEDFTSNLHGSTALVQMSVAASTRRDGRVLLWMKKHELAIRSAMLAVLADTPEADVYSVEGKDRLQKRLTAAINKVLVDTEGFGGVDAVYFKTFLVQ